MTEGRTVGREEFLQHQTTLEKRLERISDSYKSRHDDSIGRVERLRTKVDKGLAAQDEKCQADVREQREQRNKDIRSVGAALFSVLLGSVGAAGLVFTVLVYMIGSSLAPLEVAHDYQKEELKRHESQPAHLGMEGLAADVRARLQTLETLVLNDALVTHGGQDEGTQARLESVQTELQKLFQLTETQQLQIQRLERELAAQGAN